MALKLFFRVWECICCLSSPLKHISDINFQASSHRLLTAYDFLLHVCLPQNGGNTDHWICLFLYMIKIWSSNTSELIFLGLLWLVFYFLQNKYKPLEIWIWNVWVILSIILLTEVKRIIFYSPSWRRTVSVYDL